MMLTKTRNILYRIENQITSYFNEHNANLGRHVVTLLHDHRVAEMLVKMVNKLQDAVKWMWRLLVKRFRMTQIIIWQARQHIIQP